ncbi:MAG: hypothetical protein IJO62_04695 [Clostridia bacterium]|nr:hypothetical protein [Clostridia bacterium]
MKNHTLKSIFSAGSLSAKKVVSVLIAIVLCVCLMAPMTTSGALSASTGNVGQNATIYSPLDMFPTKVANSGDSTAVTLDATTYNADESDTWQFGLEKQVSSDFDVLYGLSDQDFFIDSVADFAKPVVTATDKGTEVSITWNPVTPAPEFYTVKVAKTSATIDDVADDGSLDGIAMEYKVIGTSNSINVSDFEAGANYLIQVTADGKGSKLANYGSGATSNVKTAELDVYGANIVVEGYGDSTGVLSTNTTEELGSNGLYWVVDFTNGLEHLDTTGALVLKFRVDMTQTDVDVEVAGNTVKNQDLNIIANWWFSDVVPTWDEMAGDYRYPDNGEGYNTQQATTDKYIFADNDMNKFAEIATTGAQRFALSRSDASGWGRIGFRTGYMVIPMSSFTSDFLEVLTTTSENKLKVNGSVVKYVHSDMILDDTHLPAESGMSASALWDRTVTLEGATLVSNYSEYCKENGFIEVEGDTTAVGSEVLSTSTVDANTVEYSGSAWSSKYVFSPFKSYTATIEASWYGTITGRTGIIWHAAPGEKMKFGFKAPQDGIYEFAAPLEADADARVAYAVSKVDAATGSKTYIQGWDCDYVGDGLTVTDRTGATYPDQFCDLQVELKAGDIVYLEAFCDTLGAKVNIGVPTAMKLNVTQDASENDIFTYKLSDYVYHGLAEDKSLFQATQRSTLPQTDGAWQLGYYAQKISESEDVSNVNIQVLDPNEMRNMEEGDSFSNVGDLFQQYVKLTCRISSAGKLERFAFHPWDVGTTTAKNRSDERNNAGNTFPGSVQVGGDNFGTSYTQDTSGVKVCLGYVPQTTTWTTGAANREWLGTYNVSSMLKYTAPVSGEAKLYLDNSAGLVDGQLNTADYKAKALVVHNDEVVANYTTIKDVVTELTLAEGDIVYVVYYLDWTNQTVDGTAQLMTLGNPYIEIVKDSEFVTFDTDGGYAINSINLTHTAVNADAGIIAPMATKAGAILDCWNDGENDLAPDEDEITATATLTAKWLYLGDGDGNGTIGTAEDIGVIRAAVLTDDQTVDVLNVNGDDVTDIRDLIRIKKFNAGVAGIRN